MTLSRKKQQHEERGCVCACRVRCACITFLCTSCLSWCSTNNLSLNLTFDPNGVGDFFPFHIKTECQSKKKKTDVIVFEWSVVLCFRGCWNVVLHFCGNISIDHQYHVLCGNKILFFSHPNIFFFYDLPIIRSFWNFCVCAQSEIFLKCLLQRR